MAFKKDEARDTHGRWTAIAGALHKAIDDIAKSGDIPAAKAHRAVDDHFARQGPNDPVPERVAKAVEGGDVNAGLTHIAETHRARAVVMRKQGQDKVASRHRSYARAVEAAAGKKQLTPAPKPSPKPASTERQALEAELMRRAQKMGSTEFSTKTKRLRDLGGYWPKSFAEWNTPKGRELSKRIEDSLGQTVKGWKVNHKARTEKPGGIPRASVKDTRTLAGKETVKQLEELRRLVQQRSNEPVSSFKRQRLNDQVSTLERRLKKAGVPTSKIELAVTSGKFADLANEKPSPSVKKKAPSSSGIKFARQGDYKPDNGPSSTTVVEAKHDVMSNGKKVGEIHKITHYERIMAKNANYQVGRRKALTEFRVMDHSKPINQRQLKGQHHSLTDAKEAAKQHFSGGAPDTGRHKGVQTAVQSAQDKKAADLRTGQAKVDNRPLGPQPKAAASPPSKPPEPGINTFQGSIDQIIASIKSDKQMKEQEKQDNLAALAHVRQMYEDFYGDSPSEEDLATEIDGMIESTHEFIADDGIHADEERIHDLSALLKVQKLLDRAK